jgi:hypothetical protein
MEKSQFEGITATSVREDQELKEAIEVSRCLPLSPSSKADRDRVQMSKMDFEYEQEQEKGPFCCSGTGQGRMKHGMYILQSSFPSFQAPENRSVQQS